METVKSDRDYNGQYNEIQLRVNDAISKLKRHYEGDQIEQFVERRIGPLMRLTQSEFEATNGGRTKQHIRFKLDGLSPASRLAVSESVETLLGDLLTKVAVASSKKNDETKDAVRASLHAESSESVDLTDVASRFAHKLRNHLAAIISANSQLQEMNSHQLDADSKSLLNLVGQAADLQSLLIARFSLAFGPHRVRMETVSIGPLVRSAIENCDIGDSSRIHCESFDGAEQSRLDRTLLKIIIDELIANALEATKSEPVFVSWRVFQGRLVLTVRNHGDAHPDDLYGKFLSPFFTTKPGHSGLGLNIVKSAVEALGGALRLMSTGESIVTAVSIPIQIEDQSYFIAERNN